MKKPAPPRLDVYTDKGRAEQEKKDKIAGVLFMAALPKSRWIK